MKGGDKGLPAALDADKVVRLAPLAQHGFIFTQELPVDCDQGAALAKRLHLQIGELATAVAISMVRVGDALKEARELLGRLQTVDGPVAPHRDARRMVERGDAGAVDGVKRPHVAVEERSGLSGQVLSTHDRVGSEGAQRSS